MKTRTDRYFALIPVVLQGIQAGYPFVLQYCGNCLSDVYFRSTIPKAGEVVAADINTCPDRSDGIHDRIPLSTGLCVILDPFCPLEDIDCSL